ncbi:centrosome and spindle pole associated protein 1-like isoform X2 [Parambassis ranga]|uniref:Centrosome and spindle pole associated protein 1-like isoform X2 n=1 Tax=Parambassis ranga TaxID=210632 RepID=A0A6P7J6V1_9TELE|nr:centrosome and spindle pole associated protein 1-like isoform X2 [Parambassis ranga]
MEINDELEKFIRERKARVAEDKASLEHDPPYMEIRAKPYRDYGSTVKENIPPKSTAQRKEESCMMSLPHSAEYERKKQRLQHELCMDYRNYVGQTKHVGPVETGPLLQLDNGKSVRQHLLEDQAGVLPKQRSPLQKDAATLTEGRIGLHRALFQTEEDEEQSSVTHRHRDRLRRHVDQESEEEYFFKDKLGPLEGRGRRHVGVEASFEERRLSRTDGREKRENPGVGDQEFRMKGRRLKALTKNEDAGFATGLIIGAPDTDEALLRRKECYRRELQEQIAEQQRNKKREKDLELRVAATGANDPEKPPDRIRQFGLSRRNGPQVVLEPSPTGESESSTRILPNTKKIGVREREMPPPEQPHVVFQSPLLEYSSALGFGGGGLSPNSQQPAVPSFPSVMDIPRNPLFPPYPPSVLSEACRSPYGEPHHYYGTRNLLDPNMAYYGHPHGHGTGLPMSYWNIPQGGAVPSQFGTHSPPSQHSGSSYFEAPTQPSNDTAKQVRAFPSERSRTPRDRVLSYREALNQQIQDQQKQKQQEKEEKERYEAQLEADMRNHQPWGRGGGGAPLRDSTGKLIADLNQMHKLNEEAYSNPEQWQRRAAAVIAARQPVHRDPNERVSGFAHVQTPQFARGKVFANQATPQQLQEQDEYMAYLKQQIEEKMRKKAEEKEQTRLAEEKEERRLAEERARIQREYDEEQEGKKRKEMEQKAENEKLNQLAEQRKMAAERKKEVEENEAAALRRQYERERQARVEEVHRVPSPPIPTLQRRQGHHQYTPRPPTVDSQHSTAPLSERSLSGLQSPPVPACRNQLRAAEDQRDVFSELSALRRQLHSEQKRLESHLQQSDWEELDSPLSNRHQERPFVDVFDMARLRRQAPVRRPNSTNAEPRNLLRIHNSLQLKDLDGELRLGFREDPKLEDMGVTSRRRRDYRDLYQQFSSQRSTVQDDYSDLSSPLQNDYLRSITRRSARGSLLESESAFIGDASPLPHTPELERAHQLSARERRRLAKQSQRPQEQVAYSQLIGRHDDHSRLWHKAELSDKNRTQNTTGRLMAPSHHRTTAGPLDLSDDDSSPPLRHQGSVESFATNPWMRPETSDTLKRLDRPLRRERLAT